MKKKDSKFYIAVIFSNYQEENLKRFIEYFKIHEKIILIRYQSNDYQPTKFSKNVTKKKFISKFFFIYYFFYILLRYIFIKKKFIFGDLNSKFCGYLRKYIDGENQIYLDDGASTIIYDFNKLKKDTTLFTIYNIKTPNKINKIKYLIKYQKRNKINSKKILFVGSPLLYFNHITEINFKKIMNIISKKHKKIYYYPHRFENKELLFLPKNFKILNRVSSVEKFIQKSKYNFKSIYCFASSSVIEIFYSTKKKNINILDIYSYMKSSKKVPQIKVYKEIYNYFNLLGINVKKI
jgi:hypothetical protein